SAQWLLKEAFNFFILKQQVIIMHSTFRKIIAAVMIMSIGFFAQAQTPGQTNPAQSEERQGSPKDEFVKNLKDFQPKLDDLKMKAKDNEEKYPDFSKEVASLDNMVTSFKSKVDEFD